MAYYYSASERAFFSSEFMTVGEMPSDKVAVADDAWRRLIADQSSGRIIRSASNRSPESAAQTLPTLTGYYVPGNVSISGAIDVAGAVTMKRTLNVAGKTTLKDVSAAGISGATVTTTGNATIGGALTASGAATLKGTLIVAGKSTLNDVEAINANISNDAVVDGSLTVKGKSTLKALSATDIDAVTLDTTGNATVGGTLTVRGSAVVGGKNVVRTVNGFTANASGAVTVPNYEQDGVKIVANPDYNTIVDPGFYHCYSSGAQNGPGFPSKMIVFANKSSNGHTTQVAFPIHTETDEVSPCYRSKNENGTWERWRKLIDDDDLRAIGLWRFSKGDTGIDDCNAVDLTKFSVGWTRSTTLNAPVKNWCAIITQAGDANTSGAGVGQLAFGIQTGAVFHRTCVSNKWSEWKELAFLDSEKDFYAKSLTSKNGLIRTAMVNAEKGTTPATSQYSYWAVYDKNGYTNIDSRLAFFQHVYRQDGSVETGIFSVNPAKGNTEVAQLVCGWTPDGRKIARTSAIPADDADGAFDIATVNWTRKHGGGAFGIGEKAPSISTIAGTNDMNALTKTGFYSVSGAENTSPGISPTIAMHIERYWEAGVNAAQLSWGSGSRVFARTKTQSEGWQAWKELLPVKSRLAISSGGQHVLHNTSIIKGTLPDKTEWNYFAINDSTDSEYEQNRLAMFCCRVGQNNDIRTRMACYKPDAGSIECISLDVGYLPDGRTFSFAPHPSLDSKDNNIATTYFVKKTIDAQAGIMTKKGSRSSAGTLTVSGLKANQLIIVTCNMRNDTWDGGDYALVEADNAVNGWFKTGSGTGFYTTFMIATASTVNFKLTHQGISSNTMTVYAMG